MKQLSDKDPQELYRTLSTLIDNLPGFAYRCLNDTDWTMKYITKGIRDISGYPPEDFIDNHVRSYNSIIDVNDRDRVSGMVQKALGSREPFTIEYQISTKKGEKKWVWERGRGVFKKNVLKAIEGFITDISGFKRSEEELKISEARYKRLAENANDIIYRYELWPERKFSYVNPIVKTITGYSPEDHYADPELGFRLVHPDDRHLLEKLTDPANEFSRPLTLRWIRKDGEIIWTEQKNVPVKDDQGRLIAIEGIARDVTEYKKNEEKMKLFSSGLEKASNAIVITDPEGKIEWINKAWTDLTGYTGKEVIGRNPRIIKSGQQDDHYYRDLWETITGGRVWHGELINKRKNGTFYYEDETITPLTGPNGEISHFIGIKQDITERKNSEKQLLSTKQLLLKVFEAFFDPLIIVNASIRTIALCNPAAEKVFGYSEKEILSKSTGILHIDHEHFLKFAEMGDPVLLEKGHFTTEFNMRRKNGEIFPTENSVSIISDEEGNWKYAVSLIRDITERKRIESRLRESEYQFRAIFEKAAIGIAQVSLEGNWIKVNKRFCHILGYSKKELLKKSDKEIIYHRDLDRDKEQLEKMLAGQINSFQVEKRYVHKKGNAVWCKRSVSMIRDEQDIPRYYISILEDISARKNAEAEIRSMNILLEKRVKDRTLQLENLNNELEAFSYSVSHDLKSPLRRINQFSGILKEEYSKLLDSGGSEIIERIRVNTVNMAQLVDDLLTLSKVGRVNFKVKRINMKKVAETVYQDIASKEIKERIDFSIDNIPGANGNMALMTQVWSNLLSNAIKFSSKTENARIRISGNILPEENRVIYSIKDNGVGFDMKDSHKLFTVFQRLHGGNQYKGTGIGLSLVQRIIHKHGGEVWAESAVGRGAHFYFSLPVE